MGILVGVVCEIRLENSGCGVGMLGWGVGCVFGNIFFFG